jgi:integrase/recombinase XerC
MQSIRQSSMFRPMKPSLRSAFLAWCWRVVRRAVSCFSENSINCGCRQWFKVLLTITGIPDTLYIAAAQKLVETRDQVVASMSETMSKMLVFKSIESYLESIAHTHTPNTTRVYRNAMKRFVRVLQERDIDVELMDTSRVSEEWIVVFSQNLDEFATSTRNAYLRATVGWYKFLTDNNLAQIDIEKVQSLVRSFQKPIWPSSQSTSFYDLSRFVSYMIELANIDTPNEHARLRVLRDRAFIVTLADTSLALHKVCNLRRGDVDRRNSQFVLTEKDGRRMRVQLSPRILDTLRDYLEARSNLDRNMAQSPASLPLFARHNPQTGNQILPLSTRGARKIIARRAREALGTECSSTITPKSFRHYFAASVLHSVVSLHPKIVDKCQILFENGLYDEAIFNAMKVVEEEIRSIATLNPTDVGAPLVGKAMGTDSPLIRFRPVKAEQESAYFLYRGAIGSFKSPLSHRFLEISDPVKTFECLALASLLIRMLEEAN